MATTYREITRDAHWHDTWLAPYVGYIAKIVRSATGRYKMYLNGSTYPDHMVRKYLNVMSKPLKSKKKISEYSKKYWCY